MGFLEHGKEDPKAANEQMRIIIGVTGASGSIYGWRILEKLSRSPAVELHLILSRSGERTAHLELGKSAADFRKLADFCYAPEDIGCRLSSGSFPTSAMVIAPCSIHTMSSIAAGISSNLIVRAADVTLKERRKLVLMVRESPFHLGHLRSMIALAEMGAIVAPPVPGFYHRPQTIEDLVDQSVDRVLDLLGLPEPDARRWDGPPRLGDRGRQRDPLNRDPEGAEQ
ncbi:MAG TPA: UbiX family flavin prenyltransferase [Bryobacteraceae bacterium]|nr:UbiX family flavin prenyltransferase [Bryobacteraceae bacterium]